MPLSSFLRRLSGSHAGPLLPQHDSSSSSSSTYALQSLKPPPLPPAPPTAPSLLALHRHEAHLQHHLQLLLDAQSAGLLAGLATPDDPTTEPTTPGSPPPPSTPAAPPPPPSPSARASHPPPLVPPVRQTTPPPLGLQGARRGIARTLRELAEVLGEEEAELRGEELRREEWVRGMEEVEGLREEKRGAEVEIEGLEERVRGLRGRARWLGREVERRVGVWGGEGGGGGGRLEGERVELGRRREGVRREREAVGEGVGVWEEVVGVVGGVEGRLRVEMGRLGGGGEGMRAVLELMDRAIGVLEERVRLARTRGWKLLVCAVGAELEAFRQGRQVLRAALDAVGGEEDLLPDIGGEGAGERGDDGAEMRDVGTASEENFGTLSVGGVPVREHRVRAPPSLLDRSEDEDDGPGPEFLSSYQEEDE